MPIAVDDRLRAGRLVHERHELVGEAGHGAADADAADVGAAADAGHPAALGDVAVDHRPPAADLHQALGRAVLVGEVALLVVAAAVAALVDRLAEQPGRPQLLVQRDHRGQARRLVEQVEQRLHEVVRLHGTARHVDDRHAGLRPPVPAQVIGQAHAAGGVARHGVDAAVGGAGAGRDDGPGLGGQAVDPVAGRDRLAGLLVGAQGRPVALVLDLLVGDRALDDQDERVASRPSSAWYQYFMKSSPTS